jgi:hypothetical protein
VERMRPSSPNSIDRRPFLRADLRAGAFVFAALACASCEPAPTAPETAREAPPAPAPAMPQVVNAFGAVDAASPFCPTLDSCPSDVPEAGSPCDGGQSCTYGDGAAPECATTATCVSSTGMVSGVMEWFLMGPTRLCGQARPDTCPATFADARDDAGIPPACDAGLRCEYAQGICGCALAYADDGGPWALDWTCSIPTPGCPEQRPLAGTPCDGGLNCLYAVNPVCGGGPLAGANASCSCGRWQWVFSPECP